MALLNIVKIGEDVLRKTSRPVGTVTPRIIRLIDDMRDTLEESGGVGLAAPQVGVLKRIVLVDNGEEVLELINPEIIETNGTQEEVEGCLSCPQRWGIVKRPAYVKVRAMNRYGEYFEADGTELTARCFCHEIDHLNGTLFVDKAERMLTEEEIENL